MDIQSTPVEMGQEQAGRIRVVRMVILASMVAAAVVLVIFVYLLFTSPQLSNRYMVMLASAFIVLSGISLWFIRRQRVNRAIPIYTISLISAVAIAVYLLGGVTGPVTIGFVMAVVVAGLIGGIGSLRHASIMVVVIYLVMAFLEATQVLHPESVPATSSWMIEIVFFLAVFSVTALVAGGFINQTGRALAAERQRALELAEASQQAEQSVTAEREFRERETHSAEHLRGTVAGYVDYLSRVSAGDYTARVDMGELEEDVEGDRELHALGEYLNTTVDALVAALTQAQEIQRRYAEQTWQDIVQSGRAQSGFAYRKNEITPEAEWLPQMTRAVDSGAAVAEGEGAAVPLVVNRQVVGALGGEHPDGRPWTDEELTLIENVTGQLAQTIESLRLFDDVQRRAVQERLVGDVTARIRESFDVETVLKTAAQEMRRSLGLDKITIHMEIPQE